MGNLGDCNCKCKDNKQEGEVTIGEEKGYVHNNILIIYKTINSDMKTKIETILNM